MTNFLRLAGTLALGLFAVAAESSLSFEVASIRPADRTRQAPHGTLAVSGPRVTLTGYTLSALIQYAYDIRNYQLSGASGWIASDTFTIAAKVEGDRAPEAAQVRQLLQSLLAERFGLKLHRESKEAGVFLLKLAKGGHRLTPSTAVRMTHQTGAGHLMMAKVTTAQMASILTGAVGRPVLDQTGLSGEFDFALDSPDINVGRMLPLEEQAGPSVFTAVQEQLGLRLEPARRPIEMLSIDRAEKPLEN